VQLVPERKSKRTMADETGLVGYFSSTATAPRVHAGARPRAPRVLQAFILCDKRARRAYTGARNRTSQTEHVLRLVNLSSAPRYTYHIYDKLQVSDRSEASDVPVSFELAPRTCRRRTLARDPRLWCVEPLVFRRRPRGVPVPGVSGREPRRGRLRPRRQ